MKNKSLYLCNALTCKTTLTLRKSEFVFKRSSIKPESTDIIHKVKVMNCSPTFSVTQQDSVKLGKSSTDKEARK